MVSPSLGFVLGTVHGRVDHCPLPRLLSFTGVGGQRENWAGFPQGRELSDELSEDGFVVGIRYSPTVGRAGEMRIDKGAVGYQSGRHPGRSSHSVSP